MTDMRLGYLPDIPSDRDILFQSVFDAPKDYPRSVDLRKHCDILDQKALGSCVSNAGFGAIRMLHSANGIDKPKLGCRLIGYWGARAYDNNHNYDSGSRIRNFFRFLNSAGYMPESDTTNKYQTEAFRVPPNRRESRRMADQRNRGDGRVEYERISDVSGVRKMQIRRALSENRPVVAGLLVTDAIRQYKDGVLPLPKSSDTFIGGHAMYVAGYDEDSVTFANSWGLGYGEDGFVRISWEYVLSSHASDLWVVQRAPYFSEAT